MIYLACSVVSIAFAWFRYVRYVYGERSRLRSLHSFAVEHGWDPAFPVAAVLMPTLVAETIYSERCELALSAPFGRFSVWMVWTRRASDGIPPSEHDVTRYFVWVGYSHPEIRLRHRTRLGALALPDRGYSTGDPAFDKAFIVHTNDSSGPLWVLTPELRRAMLAGQLPVWEISRGVLITTYSDRPNRENLLSRAHAIVNLAHMLPPGPQHGFLQQLPT